VNLPTHFASPDAVEAWDAEFRWRQADRLRDVTIDDTWRRVADAAASSEVGQAALWAHRYMDAFARWRLLPDERLLRSLGTDQPVDPAPEPGAVLNAAAFVVDTPYAGAYFDRDRFAATASLAVRFLDDVSGATGAEPRARRVRIGMIGLADALQALDLEYESTYARHQAALIARALAEGCLRGSVELADERGSRVALDAREERVHCMRRRQMPEWLIERARRIGMCHDSLTAIDSHPNLARLANGVANGVDPVTPDAGTRWQDNCSRTYAAELEMRAEIQPWIDEPISYALVAPEGAHGHSPPPGVESAPSPIASLATARKRSRP
jgi:ribonucleoside-diphosphate reductase alpha chain